MLFKMTNTYYIYGPSEIIRTFVGQAFTMDFKGFLSLGAPEYERSGVPDRRAYFHHPLSEDELDFAHQVITWQGLTDQVFITKHPPENWREHSLV